MFFLLEVIEGGNTNMHKLKRNQKIELPQRLIFVDTETIVKKIRDTYK